MEADDILRSASLINRHLYQQRIADTAEAQTEQQQPTSYLNFDASTGLARLQSTDGNIVYGAAQTNGAIGTGENIRLRRGGVTPGYDAMPHKKTIEIPEIIKKPEGFIIWNLGFARGGAVDIAVDWFSGLSNRNSVAWKKCITDDDLMPSLFGLKLIYIPIPNRRLSLDELRKLKAFQKQGGIVFVATDNISFFITQTLILNEVMEFLDSPLRGVSNGRFFYIGNDYNDYPANFRGVRKLYGEVASEVLGGKSISVIPSAENTENRNITWIAYDNKSRTVYSGDVNWAINDGIPLTGGTNDFQSSGDNAKFAKSLLKL